MELKAVFVDYKLVKSLTDDVKRLLSWTDAFGISQVNANLQKADNCCDKVQYLLCQAKTELKRKQEELKQLQDVNEKILKLEKTANSALEFCNNQRSQGRERKLDFTPSLSTSPVVRAAPCVSPSGPSVQDLQRTGASLFIPTMEQLTDEEARSIPKQLAGRLSQNYIRDGINEINETIVTKYTLSRTSRSRLTEAQKKSVIEFKMQENKDTKGEYFFTENDLQTFSKFKTDSRGKTLLAILKNCYKLKEIKSDALVRYAVVQF